MRRALVVVAILALALLPAVAFGAGSVGWMLATEPHALPSIIPGAETVDYLAGRGMATWFLAMAAIAIGSWTYIAKWLISQLEKQRMAKDDLTAKLVGYLESDRAADRATMTIAITSFSDTQKEMAGVLRLAIERLKP